LTLHLVQTNYVLVKNNQMKSKGLGDSIEKITTATGIKKIVEAGAKALNKDCGCSKRKKILNEKFPYKK